MFCKHLLIFGSLGLLIMSISGLMENLSDVHIVETKNSQFIQPYSVKFRQNGTPRVWDLIKVHNSVVIVIFNTSRQKLILVRQFRPGVYINNIPKEDRTSTIDTDKYPAELGITLECCAGIVDKDKTLAEIAREEVLEECGYDVPVEKMEKVQTFSKLPHAMILVDRSGVGTTGDKMHLFYVEVTDEMKLTSGGGVDEELIEVVEMSIPEAKAYLAQDEIMSPGGFVAAMYWFMLNKADKFP